MRTIKKITGKSFDELKENNFNNIESELRAAGCWSYRKKLREKELTNLLNEMQNEEQEINNLELEIENNVLENIKTLAQELKKENKMKAVQGLRELYVEAKGSGFDSMKSQVRVEGLGLMGYKRTVVKSLKKRGLEVK